MHYVDFIHELNLLLDKFNKDNGEPVGVILVNGIPAKATNVKNYTVVTPDVSMFKRNKKYFTLAEIQTMLKCPEINYIRTYNLGDTQYTINDTINVI